MNLWGGLADSANTKPWTTDTLQFTFSASKGMAALCVAILVSRGYVDYSDTVASVWPEFADNGKEHITIAQAMSHADGLSALDEPPSLSFFEWEKKSAAGIAAQRPLWPPGSAFGYHPWTYGTIVAEIVQRTDPDQRNIAQFFQEEVASPLNITFYLGSLPSDADNRVSTMEWTDPWSLLKSLPYLPNALHHYWPGTLTHRTFSNPIGGPLDFNDVELLRGILPNCNGVGTAQGLAQVYDTLLTGSTPSGISLIDSVTLARATETAVSGVDLVMLTEGAFAMGFAKPSAHFPVASSDTAFGHPGFGGSLGFADPSRDIAVAYLPNRLNCIRSALDPRFIRINEALSNAISELTINDGTHDDPN